MFVKNSQRLEAGSLTWFTEVVAVLAAAIVVAQSGTIATKIAAVAIYSAAILIRDNILNALEFERLESQQNSWINHLGLRMGLDQWADGTRIDWQKANTDAVEDLKRARDADSLFDAPLLSFSISIIGYLIVMAVRIALVVGASYGIQTLLPNIFMR